MTQENVTSSSYPRSSWKMQLGVRLPAACSWEVPVTVVSPPATTYRSMKTLMVCYACKIKTDSRVPALDEQKEVYGASKAADHCLFQVKTLYADKEEKTADYLYNCLWVYLRTQRVNGQIYVYVCVCVISTCSCIVPVAFLSRATACEWLMPSAEVPQILTMRSPIWKSESLVQFERLGKRKGGKKNNFNFPRKSLEI